MYQMVLFGGDLMFEYVRKDMSQGTGTVSQYMSRVNDIVSEQMLTGKPPV